MLSGSLLAGERLFFLSIGCISIRCEVAFDLVFSGCVTCVLVLPVIPWVAGYVVWVACFSFKPCRPQVALYCLCV